MISAKWRCLTILSALILAGAAAAAPLPDEPKTASHLALIPAENPGFITVDFTGYWDEDIVKETLKKFDEAGKSNIQKDMDKLLGVELKQLSRITIIMPPTISDEDSPVVIISTTKPYDKGKVGQALAPEGKETKADSGKAYIEARHAAIHFVDDRTFIVGDPKPVIAYLNKKIAGSATRFPKAAELVAKNKLVAIADVSDYGKSLIENLPEALKGVETLAQAKPALLTLTGDKNLTLTLDMTFKDEGQAKDGAKAAQTALDGLGKLIAEGQKDLVKQAERPDIKNDALAQWALKQTTSLLKEFDDSVKKANVTQKGDHVDVAMQSKVSVARILTLTAGMLMPMKADAPPEKKIDPVPPKRAERAERAEPKAAANLLTKDARLAIAGDSITEQKLYSKYMETYILACAGRRDVHVFQYGWGGETAGGFNGRVENDLSVQKPTVVTLCYGMNDGGYKPFDEKSVGAGYEQNMRGVLKKLDGMGVKNIVIGSPGAVDSKFFGNRPSFGSGNAAMGYNDSLASLGLIDKKLAEELKLTYADVHGPMIDAMAKAKAALTDDYDVCGKDGVHPGPNGQLIMAYAFLKGLGLDGNIGEIVVDMKGEATASDGHSIASAKGGKVEITSERYPFCFDADPKTSGSTRSILPYLPFNQDLNRFTLKVKNLAGDKAKVTWGTETKEFTKEQLQSGINLAAEFSKTPFDGAFQKVMQAVAIKQNYETPAIKQFITNLRWATTEFKDDEDMTSALAAVRKQILAKDEKLRDAVLKALEPVKHTITIE